MPCRGTLSGLGIVCMLLLAMTLVLVPASPAQAFPDVPAGHPYEPAINAFADEGIIEGYKNGEFGMYDPVRRAQFAKMIVGTLGIAPKTSTATRFTDLGAPDAQGYPHVFVQAAYESGITKGTNTAQTLYAPWDSIRRDQVVTMIVRGANSLLPGTLTAPPSGAPSYFTGVPEPHGANLRTAEHNGLLDGLLGMGPGWQNTNATRGEVAQMLSSLLAMMEPAVPDTTKVLDAGALSELKSVSSDQSMLLFDRSPAVPALSPGDVIVAGVSAATPTGLLRKVTSVSNGGSTLTVRTASATLQDAIPKGSFSADVTLSPDAMSASSLGEAAIPELYRLGAAALTEDLGVSISLEDIPFGVGRLNVSGTTSLSEPPNVKFRAKWGQTGLEVSVDFATEVKTALSASASVGSSGSRTWDLLAKPYSFRPITMFVSGVPVVLVPTLQFQLKASAGASASMSKSIMHTTRLTAGLRYENGRVIPSSDFSSTFSDPVVTPSTTGGNLRVSVGPVVTLAVYDVAGPSLNTDGYLDLTVQPTQTPWWVLSGGLHAGIGLNVPYLGLSASVPNLIEWSETILEASAGEPARVYPFVLKTGTTITLIDPGSGSSVLTADAHEYSDVAWSADGTSVYFSKTVSRGEESGLYAVDVRTKQVRMIVSNDAVARAVDRFYAYFGGSVNPRNGEVYFDADNGTIGSTALVAVDPVSGAVKWSVLGLGPGLVSPEGSWMSTYSWEWYSTGDGGSRCPILVVGALGSSQSWIEVDGSPPEGTSFESLGWWDNTTLVGKGGVAYRGPHWKLEQAPAGFPANATRFFRAKDGSRMAWQAGTDIWEAAGDGTGARIVTSLEPGSNWAWPVGGVEK